MWLQFFKLANKTCSNFQAYTFLMPVYKTIVYTLKFYWYQLINRGDK